MKQCFLCGSEFVEYQFNHGQKYCSSRCRYKAWVSIPENREHDRQRRTEQALTMRLQWYRDNYQAAIIFALLLSQELLEKERKKVEEKEERRLASEEKRKASRRNYRQLNRKEHKRQEHMRRPWRGRYEYNTTRCNKLGVIPQDLTPDERVAIKGYYFLSWYLHKVTGLVWNVDHIVPVSIGGLHTPGNLQVMTDVENGRKSAQLNYRYRVKTVSLRDISKPWLIKLALAGKTAFRLIQ